MTNIELTQIRENKNLKKGAFAQLLGITPMLLGRYESGKIQIPEEIAKKAKALGDEAAATEIEVKKGTRKAARKVKEEIKEAAAEVKEAAEEKAVATEIEVKKTARRGARKAKETAAKAEGLGKKAVKAASGMPNIIIQSPMGGIITPEEIAKKVPKGAVDVYVRVDDNKLYYVLKNGKNGDIDIW
jgi:predicted transcriptional regulator